MQISKVLFSEEDETDLQGNMDDMTSSDQVLLEEMLTQAETEETVYRIAGFSKLRRNLSFELEEDENENVYVKLSEMCKSEAARQSSHLLQMAESLCNENSPKSKRKGKVFKKLVPEVEKHVFNEIQQDLCKNMWQEARKRVYGTPCKEATPNLTNTADQ